MGQETAIYLEIWAAQNQGGASKARGFLQSDRRGDASHGNERKKGEGGKSILGGRRSSGGKNGGNCCQEVEEDQRGVLEAFKRGRKGRPEKQHEKNLEKGGECWKGVKKTKERRTGKGVVLRGGLCKK